MSPIASVILVVVIAAATSWVWARWRFGRTYALADRAAREAAERRRADELLAGAEPESTSRTIVTATSDAHAPSLDDGGVVAEMITTRIAPVKRMWVAECVSWHNADDDSRIAADRREIEIGQWRFRPSELDMTKDSWLLYWIRPEGCQGRDAETVVVEMISFHEPAWPAQVLACTIVTNVPERAVHRAATDPARTTSRPEVVFW